MALRVDAAIAPDAPKGAGAPGARELRAAIRDGARAALRHQGIEDAELSVTLLGDAGIAELNQRFLDHEGPTDVISFPLWEEGEPPVGDIYVGLAQAYRQAAAHGVAPLEEVIRLVVHGTLHVLGYDHPDGEARLSSEMWRVQEEIVAGIVGE